MIPRIHIRRPSGASTPSLEGVFGTGNELINALEEVSRHRHHDEAGKRNSGDYDDDEEVFSPITTTRIAKDGGFWGHERLKWWKIYAMHFLFMWNSRTFEYVSVFLVALAFPKSLTATSIRGITSTVSALLCSSAVGSRIDRSEVFGALTTSIIVNHMAIVASYIGWLLWPAVAGSTSEIVGGPFSTFQTGLLYAGLLLLDVIHDLSYIGNRLCLERNLVPVLIGPVTPDMTYDLTQVNSVMVRLELVVKLVAPTMLPVLMSLGSREGWILILVGMTIAFFLLELWILLKIIVDRDHEHTSEPVTDSEDWVDNSYPEVDFRLDPYGHPKRSISMLYRVPAQRLIHYFSVPMWPASIAAALLHLTVLAYSATLITYLLEIGFTVTSVTAARALGALTALGSTMLTPAIVQHMRRKYNEAAATRQGSVEDEAAADAKIARKVGSWGIVSQFLCLIPVAVALWGISPAHSSTPRTDSSSSKPPPHYLIPILLFGFLSLSRVGHFMVLLMVQELGQVEIPASQRSTFAGTEQSFKSGAELCHWFATLIWSRPEQFQWLALGSVVTVGSGAALFWWWAKKSIGKGGERYESIGMQDFEGE